MVLQTILFIFLLNVFYQVIIKEVNVQRCQQFRVGPRGPGGYRFGYIYKRSNTSRIIISISHIIIFQPSRVLLLASTLQSVLCILIPFPRVAWRVFQEFHSFGKQSAKENNNLVLKISPDMHHKKKRWRPLTSTTIFREPNMLTILLKIIYMRPSVILSGFLFTMFLFIFI